MHRRFFLSWCDIALPTKLFCSVGLVVQSQTEHAICIVQELLKSLQDLPVPSSNPEPGRSHVKGEGADFLLAEAADTLKAMQVCVHLHPADSHVDAHLKRSGVSQRMTGLCCCPGWILAVRPVLGKHGELLHPLNDRRCSHVCVLCFQCREQVPPRHAIQGCREAAWMQECRMPAVGCLRLTDVHAHLGAKPMTVAACLAQPLECSG